MSIFQESHLLSFFFLYCTKRRLQKFLHQCVVVVVVVSVQRVSYFFYIFIKHSPSIYLSLFLNLISTLAHSDSETCYRYNPVVGLRKSSPLALGTHREVYHKELQSSLHVTSSPPKKTHPMTSHLRLNDLSVSQNSTCAIHMTKPQPTKLKKESKERGT